MTLVDRPGQPEFGMTVYASNGAPVSVLSITSGVGTGQIPGLSPLNGSATADLSIPVGGTDTVRVRLGFPSGLGNTGDLVFDRKVWVDINPTNGQIDTGELYEFLGADEDPFPIPCDPTVDPNRQLGMQVHLPILTFKGQDSCDVWIEVQNDRRGRRQGRAGDVGRGGVLPAAGGRSVEGGVHGLAAAGLDVEPDGRPDPGRARRAACCSSSRRSSCRTSGWTTVFGFDDIFADLMCETLFFGVVGDADDFRRFKKAYNEGGAFAGIPQDMASGAGDGGILAVDVLRTCDADVTAGAKVTSKYNGIAGSHLGDVRPGVRRLHLLRAAGVREADAGHGSRVQHVDVHPERRARVLVGRDLAEEAGRLPAGADLRSVDAGAG